MEITLLDGTIENQSELCQKAYSDNFYYNVLGKIALSSSSCKLLLDSPKTYHYVQKYGQESSQAMRDGWLFHTMILEPEKIDEVVFVNCQSKNAKEYKEAVKYHNFVFTMKEKHAAERLVDGFFRCEQAKSYLTKAKTEVPMVGQIRHMPFRAKADILTDHGIIDLKTTVNVKDFHHSASKFSYDLQTYIYCKLFDKPFEEFKFIAIDKKNLDIGVFSVSQDFYESGKRKCKKAIELYNQFFTEENDINNFIYEGTL